MGSLLSLGLGFSTTGGNAMSAPSSYNSAGIYFGNADIGAVGLGQTPATYSSGTGMGTWLLIGGAVLAAWLIFKK